MHRNSPSDFCTEYNAAASHIGLQIQLLRAFSNAIFAYTAQYIGEQCYDSRSLHDCFSILIPFHPVLITRLSTRSHFPTIPLSLAMTTKAVYSVYCTACVTNSTTVRDLLSIVYDDKVKYRAPPGEYVGNLRLFFPARRLRVDIANATRQEAHCWKT